MALQAAPGQWPGSSPDTNSPTDFLCPGSAYRIALGLRAVIVPGSPEKSSESADEHAHSAPARMGWARLLERVFDIDLAHCPQCGGAFRIIAAIEERTVIVGILTHLGSPARAPPRSPARPLDLFQAA